MLKISTISSLILVLMLVSCASLPPDTPETFSKYNQAIENRSDTLLVIARSLYKERGKANEAILAIAEAINELNSDLPLKEQEADIDKIKRLITTTDKLTKPDLEVENTINHMKDDFARIYRTGDLLYDVVATVAEKQSSTESILERASHVIEKLSEKDKEGASQ